MPSVRPTPLAILLMGLGVPLMLVIAWLMPGFWVFCFAGIAAILSLLVLDALATRSSSSFDISVDAPMVFFVGEGNQIRTGPSLIFCQGEADHGVGGHALS